MGGRGSEFSPGKFKWKETDSRKDDDVVLIDKDPFTDETRYLYTDSFNQLIENNPDLLFFKNVKPKTISKGDALGVVVIKLDHSIEPNGTITLRPKMEIGFKGLFSDIDKIKEVVHNQRAIEKISTGSEFHVPTHELAHVLEISMMIKEKYHVTLQDALDGGFESKQETVLSAKKEFFNLLDYGSNSFITKMPTMLAKEIGIKAVNMADKISSYSFKNPGEFFAEAYAKRVLAEKVDVEFNEAYDKVLSKYKY